MFGEPLKHPYEISTRPAGLGEGWVWYIKGPGREFDYYGDHLFSEASLGSGETYPEPLPEWITLIHLLNRAYQEGRAAKLAEIKAVLHI